MTRKLVPVIGTRVKAALAWKGFTEREAVRQLSGKGIRVKQQTLNLITGGVQKTCKPGLRNALAVLCGPPIASEYLGGETEMTWVPAPRAVGRPESSAAELPREGSPMPESVIEAVLGTPEARFDMNERPLPGTRWQGAFDGARVASGFAAASSEPPLYQLEARSLTSAMEEAWRRQAGPDAVPLHASVPIALLLSLVFWRRLLMEDAAGGLVEPKEMDEFAKAMARTLRLALKPLLEGAGQVRIERLFQGVDQLSRIITTTHDIESAAALTGARAHMARVAAAKGEEQPTAKTQPRVATAEPPQPTA